MPGKHTAAAPSTTIDRARRDDAHPEQDGDNSILAVGFPAHAKRLRLKPIRAAAAQATRGVAVAPFGRELHEGVAGRDVVAVKRALRAWKPTSITNRTSTYGAGAVKAVAAFQKAHRKPGTGVYDKATHALLAPFFDAYGVFLLMHSQPAEPSPRKKLVIAALALMNYHRDTGRVHYTEDKRRMSVVRNREKVPFSHVLWEDCSSFVTACYFLAGLPDPNGSRYNGSGYTGTLGENGRVVATPFPGDVTLYPSAKAPRWPWGHTTIAIGDDTTKPATHCLSHGAEGNPVLLAIDYRKIGQHRSYL